MDTRMTLSLAAALCAGLTLAAETPPQAVPAAKIAPAAAQAPAAPAKPAVEGAALGQWTMDLDAAKALAKREGKPLLLNFTGSDWCGWCKLMDSKVFSQKAWQDYAAGNLVLVWVDFPRNKALVPERYRARNDALAETYGIGGYPTYVLLSPEGERIGTLNASASITPQIFIDQIADALIAPKIGDLLSAEDLAAYRAAEKEMEALEAEFDAWQTRIRAEGEAFQTKSEAILRKIDALKAKARAAAKR